MNVNRLKMHIKKYAVLISGVLVVSAVTVATLFMLEALPLRFATSEASADWYCQSLTATPSEIHPGESSTLEWSFVSDEGDMTVTIMQLPGQEWQGTTGSVVVSPTVTTLYHVMAHREGVLGTVDCTTIVRVVPLVECDCDNVRLYVNEFSFTYDGPPPLEEYKVDFCDGSTTGTTTGQWGDVETFNFQQAISHVSVRGSNCYLEESRECTPPPAEPWCAMNVNPTTIQQSGTTTLSWDSEHVTSVDIPGVGVGLAPVSSTVLSPATTTTYTGTFHTDTGSTLICNATVTVLPPTPGPNPSCSISANPGTIDQGGTSTIAWGSTDVVSVDIPGIGIGLSPAGSSVVSPATTTTYIGTFHAVDDTQLICNVTVTVRPPNPTPPPTCSLSANPSTIGVGGTSTITWSGTNVSSVDVTNIGSGLASSGSTNVSPATTTTYVGTFHGTDGTDAICQATVTVSPPNPNPNPSCSINISPSSVRAGGTATLSWTSTDVVSGSIDNGIGSVGLNGSMSIIVNRNTTYTGTFRDAQNNTVTCSDSVTIRSGGGGGGGGSCLNCSSTRGDDTDREPNPSIILGKTFSRLGGTITLDQVPYTGFKAGPLLTTVFWVSILLASVLIAYIVTHIQPLTRVKLALERNRGKQVQQHIVLQESIVSPYTVPTGNSITKTAADVMGSSKNSTVDQIEEMAHKENILLSPEALRIIQKEIEETDKDALLHLAQLFAKVKAEYPREDGWILLSKERLESVVVSEVTTNPIIRKADIPTTLMSNTDAQINQNSFRVEPKPVSMYAELKKEQQTESKVRNAGNSTNNVVVKFIDHLVNVEKKEAFDLLRNMSTNGIDVAAFMTLVVRQLDEVYKQRIEGDRNPGDELVRKTASWKDEDFETLLGILVECVDYSYSNNRVGTKVALAKAFEHFSKK